MSDVGCGDAPKGHPNPDAYRRKNPPQTPGRWSMSARQWVIGRMEAWHNGPFGGQCPSAGTDRECSRYGVRAVQRWGAVIGVLAAARQVALCKPYPSPGDPDPNYCGPGDPDKARPNPRRLGLFLLPLVGLHLREALPKPQGSPCAMLAVMRVLFMFGRLALLRQPGRQGPPHDPNRDGCGPG